jgi:hypothetical protein
MMNMYDVAEFVPISAASIRKLMNGGAARVQHGTGMRLPLSKAQMKKHRSASMKGKGYNLQLDPYQISMMMKTMTGKGFFDDIGAAFTQHIIEPTKAAFQEKIIAPIEQGVQEKIINPFQSQIINPIQEKIITPFQEKIIAPSEQLVKMIPAVMPSIRDNVDRAGKQFRRQGKKLGRKVASTLIHQGIPMAAATLGGIAGAAAGTAATANPLGSYAGEAAGSMAGEYGGTKLADYIGRKTGYGLMDIVRYVAPHAKKALYAVGKELGKQAITKGLDYAAKKATEKGVPPEMIHASKQYAHQAAQGSPLEAEEMVREIIEGTLQKHPQYEKVSAMMRQMFGHGAKKRRMKGGTALIDQPFTVRQGVDSADRFFKDPAGTFGFGAGDQHPLEMMAKNFGFGAKKRRKMKGGTALIDQPFTVRQGVDSADRFFKDPAGTFGFGAADQHPLEMMAKNFGFGAKKRRMKGGTALIDQPFTVRQGVDSADRFFKDPAGTFGFGAADQHPLEMMAKNFGFGAKKRRMKGGTALIDQPFTVRQAVDTSRSFIDDPAGAFGFGARRGGALIQAGYR